MKTTILGLKHLFPGCILIDIRMILWPDPNPFTEKIEKAVDIILKILDNHEGMDPELPPRAYFNTDLGDAHKIITFIFEFSVI